jgi:hypothetical protein
MAKPTSALRGRSLREEHETPSWTDVFAPRWRTPLIIGLGLAVLQQITGINAIIYYSDSIFAAAGFTTPAAQTQAPTWAIGAVNWTVINEIYPGEVRGRAVAVATAVNWGAAFLVSGFFLSVVNAIGQADAFWLFAAFCAIGLVWVIVGVPETRGRSLEEIEASWGGAPARQTRR